VPITYVNTPDGKQLPIQHPDDASQIDILRFAELQFNANAQAPVPESSAARRYLGDPLLGLAKGAVGLGESFVGLGDIVTGGRLGKNVEEGAKRDFGGTPQDLQNYLQSLKTPEQQAQEKSVSEAKGFFGTSKALIDNPAALLDTVLQSAPQMAGGAGIARAGLKSGLLKSPVAAGAVGEGVLGAGSSAESIRQQTETGLLDPRQAAIASISGVFTGVLGRIGAKAAQKLGVTDVDTLLAGGASQAEKKSIIVSAIKGAIAEGTFEELPQSMQEQIANNIALDKDPYEGVAEAAATGMFAGGVMGGGANLITQTATNLSTSINGTDNNTPPPSTDVPTPEPTPETPPVIPNEIATNNSILSMSKSLMEGNYGTESNQQTNRGSFTIPTSAYGQSPGVSLEPIRVGLADSGDVVAAATRGEGTKPIALETIQEAAPTNTPVEEANKRIAAGLPFTDITQLPDNIPEESKLAQVDNKKEMMREGILSNINRMQATETSKNPTLPEEQEIQRQINKRFVELKNLYDTSPYINASLNAVEDYKKKNKLTNYTVQSYQVQNGDAVTTQYALIPKKNLTGTSLQNILTELTLYDATLDDAKKYDFNKGSQMGAKKVGGVRQYLEDTLTKKQFNEIAKQDNIFAKLAKAYKNGVRSGGLRPLNNNLSEKQKDNYVEKTAVEIQEERLKQFDEKVKGREEYANLHPYIKTGSAIYSPISPIETNEDITAMTQTAIDDAAFEEAAAQQLRTSTDKIDKDVLELARQRNVEDPSAFRPLEFMTEDEYKAILNKHRNKLRTKTPEDPQEIKTMRTDFFKSLSKEDQQAAAQKTDDQFYAGMIARTARASGRVTSARQASEQNKDINDLNKIAEANEEQRIINKANSVPYQSETARQQIKKEWKNAVNDRIIQAITQGKSLEDILSIAGMESKDLENSTYNLKFDYQGIGLKLKELLDQYRKKGYAVDVKVVFGETLDNAPGQFNPDTNTITLNPSILKGEHVGQVLIHETMHAMLDHIVDPTNRGNLSDDQLVNVNRLESLYNYIKNKNVQISFAPYPVKYAKLTDRFEIGNLKEFIAEAFSNRDFQKALAELSPRVDNKGKPVIINNLRKFANYVAGALGMRTSNTSATVLKDVLNTVENILRGDDYLPPKLGVFQATGISKAPKKAENKPEVTSQDLENRYVENQMTYRPTGPTQVLKNSFFSGQRSINFLVTNFQNARYAIKKWQDDLEKSGLLKVGSDLANNVFDKITAFS
jgi:hypothetical protein